MSEVLGQPPQKKQKKNIKFLIKNIIESFKDIGSG